MLLLNTSVNNSFNDSLQWKLVGSITGTSQIAIPSDAKEIFVKVTRGTTSTICYDYNIPVIALTDDEVQYCRNYYTGASAWHSCMIVATKTYLHLDKVLVANSTNVASSSTIYVYYR